LANPPKPTILAALDFGGWANMVQTKTIDLTTANAILAAVIAASRARNRHPMTMCILDPGGHVVAA
jgi:uncharacterized protein GlcG (DUF336 family)